MTEQTLRIMLSNATKRTMNDKTHAFVFETLRDADRCNFTVGTDETAEVLEAVRDLMNGVKDSILADLIYFQCGALVDFAASDFIDLAWDDESVTVSFLRFGKGIQSVKLDFDYEQSEYLLIGAYDEGLLENTHLTQEGYEIDLVGVHYYDE